MTFESRDRAPSRPESGIAVTKILSVTELQSNRNLRGVREFLLKNVKNPKNFPALRSKKLIAVTKIISVTEHLADPKP